MGLRTGPALFRDDDGWLDDPPDLTPGANPTDRVAGPQRSDRVAGPQRSVAPDRATR